MNWPEYERLMRQHMETGFHAGRGVRVESAKPLVGVQVSTPPYFERVEQKDAKGTKEEQTREAMR